MRQRRDRTTPSMSPGDVLADGATSCPIFKHRLNGATAILAEKSASQLPYGLGTCGDTFINYPSQVPNYIGHLRADPARSLLLLSGAIRKHPTPHPRHRFSNNRHIREPWQVWCHPDRLYHMLNYTLQNNLYDNSLICRLQQHAIVLYILC